VVVDSSGIERRRYPRYSVVAEVVLFSSHHSFRTKCINISLNGVLLAEPVPHEMIDEIIDVVILAPFPNYTQRILLSGMMVGKPFRTPRIAFVNTPMIQFMKLQDLISLANVA
jgi:hypothetical protein